VSVRPSPPLSDLFAAGKTNKKCGHCGFIQANVIGGRNEKAVREFLEKNWAAGLSQEDSVRITIKALLEVVDSGSKNIEIAIITRDQPVQVR